MPDETHPRTAVVTGAARALGRAICQRLARDGAAIVAVDLLNASTTLAGLDEAHAPHRAPACDVSDPAAVAQIVRQQSGGCDVLVNCAGILATGGLADTSHERWSQVMAVNVEGMFLRAQALAPAMAERGAGRIVSIGSTCRTSVE